MTGAKKKGPNKGHANLAPPIKPGEVRNPRGRPKGTPDGIGANLRRALKSEAPEQIWERLRKIGIKDAKGSNAKAVAYTLITLALERGDVKAIRLLKDFVEPNELKIDAEQVIRIVRE